MIEVQKQTYIDIIQSTIFSNDPFIAKSITLDLLYSFENPCTSIVYLTDYLNQDYLLGRMGVNCVYGIVLAIEEYKKFYPTVIIHRFVDTLITFVSYKIGDTGIRNYKACMSKILKFIGDNLNYKLLHRFVDLGSEFKYIGISGTDISEENGIFEEYCNILEKTCERLSKENHALFEYKVLQFKDIYAASESDDSVDKKINSILKDVCEKRDCSEVVVISSKNNSLSSNTLNSLDKELKVLWLDIDDIDDIDAKSIKKNTKVIMLVDTVEDHLDKILFYYGVIKERVNDSNVLICFSKVDDSDANKNDFVKKIISCNANETNFEDRLARFLQGIRRST